MKYEVKDEKTGELRTTGSSSHCFLDKDKKLIALKHTYPKLHQLLTECVKK
jgi:acyl-CoA thioester hydrolase